MREMEKAALEGQRSRTKQQPLLSSRTLCSERISLTLLCLCRCVAALSCVQVASKISP